MFDKQLFKQLQQLQIRTRKSYLGLRQGAHLSPKRGHGLELADFRPYTPGDDFRHIDWGVYGRSERLYIREFREETELNILILIDLSSSMSFPKEKLELAKSMALSLSYIALQAGDSVRIAPLGDKRSINFSSPRAFQRMYKFINELSPKSEIDFLTELRKALSITKIPGKCFLISDFLFETEEIFSGLDQIKAKNFEISLLQILSEDEVRLESGIGLRLIDSETSEELSFSSSSSLQKEYSEILSAHISALENYCEKSQIPLASVLSNTELRKILFDILPKKGFLS